VGGESGSGTAAPRKRADARRNEATLLDAAAAAFIDSGVNVPVRDIAARAGVGVGTIYRHFPTRADLIVAVYRHQVQACAEAGPVLLADCDRPRHALDRWIGMFVDFLVTKHGLADVLRSDDAAYQTLHAYFIDRLVPVCGQLLEAAAAADEIRPGQDAYELLRGVGSLCAGVGSDARYDPRHLVGLLIAGLRIRLAAPAMTGGLRWRYAAAKIRYWAGGTGAGGGRTEMTHADRHCGCGDKRRPGARQSG
jgi:AcrR family transcriptional regulator